MDSRKFFTEKNTQIKNYFRNLCTAQTKTKYTDCSENQQKLYIDLHIAPSLLLGSNFDDATFVRDIT